MFIDAFQASEKSTWSIQKKKKKKDPDQEINEPKRGQGIGVSLNRLKNHVRKVQKFPCKPIRPAINRRKRLFTDRREPTLQKTL